jgi:hypothetical protein
MGNKHGKTKKNKKNGKKELGEAINAEVLFLEKNKDSGKCDVNRFLLPELLTQVKEETEKEPKLTINLTDTEKDTIVKILEAAKDKSLMEQPGPGPTVQEIEKLNELIEIFRSGRENVSALLTNCKTEVDKLGENECFEQSNIEFKLSKEEINLNLNENQSTETIVKNDDQGLRIPQEISVVSIQSIESLGNNDMSVLSVTFTQSEKTLNQPVDENENKYKLNNIESKNSLTKNNILFFLPKKSTENLEKLEKNDEPKKLEISSELSLSCSKNLNSIVDNYNIFGFNLFQHLFHEKS